MICDLCREAISLKRLAAVPHTRLCVACKSLHDEPRLMPSAPVLAGSLAQGSIGDLEEMQAESREMGGLIR